ncbi:hypothetical protein A1O1_03548 [Capronia coronata CBS 617.96]|uniref:Uncharacterized protein n=1 Tax=Capronia coronata CBS 617.96 TaxID=1182541 RepID=W9YMJ4_9EURO|nr:uncharacterized protein A1O1_03548 [Capronia coronata CBS 617.96]EXJ90446.1 hypothetical protein A1O1_03548 [Capronia coronata CBS 617.96]
MSYLPLLISLPVLMIDGLIEVGFVGSMVGFLHDRAGKSFTVDAPSGPFNLHGKPAGLLVDQGHTSNGAAGTAVILVGILGFLTIWHERRRTRKTSPTTTIHPHSGLFTFWTILTILSAMLTLAALIYTFVLTAQTDNQTIDLAVAAANSDPLMYPDDKWTPENWFVAVLALPLAHDSDRRDIRNNLRLMRGWRWNLIPLFIFGVGIAGLAVWELFRGRKWMRTRTTEGESVEKFRHSGNQS